MKKELDKKREIINKYNSTSHFYDKRYSIIQTEKYNYSFKDYSVNGKIILDAGCGTGLLYEYLFDLIKKNKRISCIYIANDISWNMLTEFKSKIVNRKKRFEANLILSDIENLPIRECTFQSVFSLTAIQNLPSTLDGLKELLRVAKNNSDVIFSILKKKIELNEIILFLKPYVKDLKIIDKEKIEDIIINGRVLKN